MPPEKFSPHPQFEPDDIEPDEDQDYDPDPEGTRADREYLEWKDEPERRRKS